MQRGVIEHRERAKQIIDFSGLRYNKITPTDIDGLIDFGNKLFILFELKLKGAEMPYGQKLAIERIVDASHSLEHPCYGLLCIHEIHNVEQDIDASKTIVTDTYFKKKWHKAKNEVLLKKAIDNLYTKYIGKLETEKELSYDEKYPDYTDVPF